MVLLRLVVLPGEHLWRNDVKKFVEVKIKEQNLHMRNNINAIHFEHI